MGDETVHRIFVALVEVRPLGRGALDPWDCAGAAVRCYIPADTEATAVSRLELAVARHRLALVELEFCIPYEGDWNSDDADGLGAAAAARSGDVGFGTFHTWGHDAPDA